MKILVSIISIALTVLFAALGSVWVGFQYFSLSCLSILCLVWVYFIVKDYIYEYVTLYDEKFNLFFVKLINSQNIDLQSVENNKITYQKKFNKTLVKEKAIEWLKIFVLYAVVGLCLIAMIKFIG